MKTPVKTAIIAALTMAAGLSAFAVEAKITSVSGKVQKQEKGSSVWVDVKQNDVINEGTILSTGFNSSVTINIDGSICTLQPLTRMSLEQLAQKDVVQDGQNKTVTKTALYLDTGKASFKVNSTDKKLNDFKMYSPASTASVRGTEGVMYANGLVRGVTGLIAVSSGGDRNLVQKNRDKFFVPSMQPISVFTSVKEVGGGGNATAVYAGNTTSVNSVTQLRNDPSNTKQQAVFATAGSMGTMNLAAKERKTAASGGGGPRTNNEVAPITINNTETLAVTEGLSTGTAAEGGTPADTTTTDTTSGISIGIHL